mmetsp:Transcript_6073/g.9309  ORF Transcript_6073/g.9309 Transcript_6073/m.9309 type:complete len:447 (-) Transcript_6073:122-1462(-)|eukprot:CAMPEP_0178904812 /NCGR_PEP_ID=MMETSP0786-20121207/5904_1 /TAXON_ID=186022 /ORGANISM="Thalassionema frauenfeldii, Strain CCMP 1798" /LENGTH=446 /DNA_ID=CAMNT_0020576303 /DNA_START=93 /DNA_END=1433 /DNA_ORIENTATION=-
MTSTLMKLSIGWMLLNQVLAFSAKSIPTPWEGRWDGDVNSQGYNSFRGYRRYRGGRRRKGYYLDGQVKKGAGAASKSQSALAATSDESVEDETTAAVKDAEDLVSRTGGANDGTEILSERKFSSVVKQGTTTTLTSKNQDASVFSCRRELWAMCRPSNFVGVFIFHALGTFLGVRANYGITEQHAPMFQVLLQTLAKPSMVVVLFCLLLISSSSMMVNDYYDSRRMTSLVYKNNKQNMVNGKVPSIIVKRCLSYIYASLLVCLALVPGVPARLAVVMGSLLTFWYTQHLKPITWLKNVTCAVIMSMAPFTSFAASNGGLFWRSAKLWRLTAMLFCGFVGREMLMDIVDVEEDSQAQIQTVPVKYGTRFASRVTFCFTVIMAILASFGNDWRTRSLGLIGGGIQALRMTQITMSQHGYLENNRDPDLMNRAVEEGKVTLLLLLASFL